MINEVWMNLPVKNLERSKVFYTQIGFVPADQVDSERSAGFKIGRKNMVLMIFEKAAFAQLSNTAVQDSFRHSEVLISIDLDSREEIDTFADKVKQAGGVIFANPRESRGWMYEMGFMDPDGHRWNALFMDYGKIS